jgi:hypothetical protein
VKGGTAIKPFFWVAHEKSFSVCLNVGEYKADLFLTREDEGFEGNGYDWASLARVFIEGKRPDLKDAVDFDPEGSMFCAYSSNADALKTFALSFKDACEHDESIQALFAKAELD